MKFTEGCVQRWDILQAQGWAHQIFGCFECTESHALQANSCLSRESFQIICAVRLPLKCACLNHEECSRRKALILWATKRHIWQKSWNEAALVYSMSSTAYSRHSAALTAHQHQGCAHPLLWGHSNCISSGKQALLNCSEHTSTPGTADAPDLAGLACCDPHTRSVGPGQEGQALKCHSTTLSSEDNCKKLQKARTWINEKD